MSPNALRSAFVGIGFLVAVACAGCTTKSGTTADGGTVADAETTGKASISCYSDVQFYCEEIVAPTMEQEDGLKVVCSSGSAVFSKPAACPPAAFVGKCTFTADGVTKTRRYYTGVDAAYNQDFCVNTAKGTWSTVF